MLKQSDFVKIRINAPVENADEIRAVLGNSGAGAQGKYSHCSYSYRGIGRFLPMTGAKPAIGEIGKSEEVKEELIEVICHKDLVEEVLIAVKKAHPYEEPAIDIIPRLDIVD